MLDFLRFWRYYRYPAHRWAVDIREILRETPRDATIIDAPCGDGVVSYWLIKHKVGRRYELYDLSERGITVAQRMINWNKARQLELQVECRNIFDVPVDHGAGDIWLLINSLYLLPDIDLLLDRMQERAQTIIGVFPRITSENYRRYVAQSPNRNINEMGQEETIEFFARHGYQLQQKREFCYIPILYLKSKLMRLAASYLVNPIETLFPRKEACYWLGAFSKSND